MTMAEREHRDADGVILTIGVYGTTEDRFARALREAGTDLLCDLRRRRGVRGSDYAFANARRLQGLLAGMGLAYRHVPALAPERETIAAQDAADRARGTSRRAREALDEEFAADYGALLASAAAQDALAAIAAAAHRPCLLCVERAPAACHRGLAAAELARLTGLPVRHIMP